MVEVLGYGPNGELTYILTVNETKCSWGVDATDLSTVLNVAAGMAANVVWFPRRRSTGR